MAPTAVTVVMVVMEVMAATAVTRGITMFISHTFTSIASRCTWHRATVTGCRVVAKAGMGDTAVAPTVVDPTAVPMAGTARRTAVGMDTADRASDSIIRGSLAINDQSMRVVSFVVNAQHSAPGEPGAVSFFGTIRVRDRASHSLHLRPDIAVE